MHRHESRDPLLNTREGVGGESQREGEREKERERRAADIMIL